jgi:two-component system nitrogen regulation sensor histidine kinase GlnL
LYSFCIDNKLRITNWKGKTIDPKEQSTSCVVGEKYFNLLPRILFENKDAISTALRKNTPVILKGYRFNCINGQNIITNIKIKPLKALNGKLKEAKVTVYPVSTCDLEKQLHNSQYFIDVGRIASSLAHGVRNPLNAIKGAVVYLTEKYADEPSLIEFAEIIENEITRLDNFISRFLSTSISEAQFSLVDINSLLNKINLFTSLQTQSSNIKSTYIFGNIPLVMINAFQIEQAILNVINNAIEAMYSGGELKVKTLTKNLSDIDFIVIEISDTGRGIAKGRMDSISKPVEKKGKGFGLFITREILQYYDGRLEIKSNKGKGTTIRLYIPIKQNKQ